MKTGRSFMWLVGMCLCLTVGSVCAQNATINIMAMGDSVTSRGDSPESSYRYWLYTYLTNAGFANTMFVGSQSGVSDGTPANPWPQEAYEGGDGWTTGNGVTDASSAADTLNSGSPGATILLLDLGSNDYGYVPTKTNLLEVQQNLETIIQTFYNANPSTVILLAVPTPWLTSDPNEKKFMSQLGSADAKAARDQKKFGVNVRLVNLHGGFNPAIGADTKDGTHPSVRGEQKIAKKYFNALRPILKKMEKEGL